MNRSALKLPCAVLFGLALGWGIWGLPQRSSETDAANDRPSGVAAQGGFNGELGSSPTEAGTGKSAGKLRSRERVEMLAAKFRDRTDDEEEAAKMSLMMDIAELSGDEFGPLMALLEKGKSNDGVMESLAVRWGMLDPKAALAFAIGRAGLGDDKEVMSSIVGELAKVDFPAAKRALEGLDKTVREDAGLAIVRRLQHNDPRAALAYARELKNDDAEAGVLSFMAETDPLSAAAELTSGKKEQAIVTHTIAVSLMQRNRTVFEEWMESLKDPEQRVTAFLSAQDVQFQPDPKNAALETAAWLSKEQGSCPGMAEVLTGSIARRWLNAKATPAEVAAWTASLPEGPSRDAAVAETGQAWVARDPVAASAWLSSLPAGEGRDRVVINLVRRISGETGADAFEWARTVQSPDTRDEALAEAVRAWSRQDPPAAEQALETLPARDRVRLRDIVEAAKEEKAPERK